MYAFVSPGPGVVVIDEDFLRAKWPMWELGVMMAALPDNGQPEADTLGQATRAVLPVVLMDFDAVTATYERLWTAAVIEAAISEGLQPAKPAELQRLLRNQAIRDDQVQLPEPTPLLVS